MSSAIKQRLVYQKDSPASAFRLANLQAKSLSPQGIRIVRFIGAKVNRTSQKRLATRAEMTLSGIRRSIAQMFITLMVLLVGCSKHVETKLDSIGDPLPPHASLRLGTLRFLPAPSWTDVIQYSYDGTHLATAGFTGTGTLRPQIQIWERRSGRDITPAKLKDVEATGIAWMPGGNRFLTSHTSDNRWAGLKVWTVGRDNPDSIVSKDQGFLTVVCARTADRFAARTDQEEIVIFDAKGIEEFRFPFRGKQRAYNVANVIDFSFDGKSLAAVSESGVEIYDLATRVRTVTLKSPADYMNCVRFLPDGRSIAVATNQGTHIIPIGSDNTDITVFGSENVENIAVSSDGRWLANSAFIGSGAGSVWELKSGKRLCSLHVGINGGIAFAPNDSELAVSTRRISFVETETWKERPTNDGHFADIAGGILVDNELWTGEFGPLIRQWSLTDGTSHEVFNRGFATTSAMAFISNTELAVAGLAPEIDILSMESQKVVVNIEGSEPSTTALAYSPQHRRLISAGPEGIARGREFHQESQTYSSVFEQAIGIKPSRPTLAVSPDGEFLACGNASWGYAYLLKASDGHRCWAADTATSRSLSSPVAFTPDSKQVATIASGLDSATNQIFQCVRFLDTATGETLNEFDCKAPSITAIAISPDGQFAAVATVRNDAANEIQIWSMRASRRIGTLAGHYDPAHWLTFTRDSTRLISLSSDTGLVWDLEHVTNTSDAN